MKNVIEIKGVSKVFHLGVVKRKTAVTDLTLSVPKGKVVGLLGPNGSGKSTTLKMILGFLRPSLGSIEVCGVPSQSRHARHFIGYLPENPRFPRFLSGLELLDYYGGLLGLAREERHRRSEEMLQLVGLKGAEKERVRGYSKGMTQRLAIAQSLMGRPSILIFDEPMSGLDPLGRMEIRNLISQVHEEFPETTIFFSTHILADVEKLCSEVALLREGRLAAYSPIKDLLGENEERFEVLVPTDSDVPEGMPSYTTPAGITLQIQGVENLLQHLGRLKEQGRAILGISSHRLSLEEALFGRRKGSET